MELWWQESQLVECFNFSQIVHQAAILLNCTFVRVVFLVKVAFSALYLFSHFFSLFAIFEVSGHVRLATCATELVLLCHLIFALLQRQAQDRCA